jgi:hypothetical protein
MRTLKALLLCLMLLGVGSGGYVLGQHSTHVEREYSEVAEAKIDGIEDGFEYVVQAQSYMDVCKPVKYR